MKTLFKPLVVLFLATVSLTSCMDNNNSGDNEAELLAREKTIDSLLSADKDKIEEYLAASTEEWVEDTVKIVLPRLGKNPQRGLWYQVIVEPTEEDDEAYDYEVQGNGLQYQVIPPANVKLKYAVYSLTSEEALEEDVEGSDYTFTSSNANLNYAWILGFYPATAKSNGNDVQLGELTGLTEKGLKKGSKIRIIVPSYWLANPFTGRVEADYLPSNAPAIYEFEVLDIR